GWPTRCPSRAAAGLPSLHQPLHRRRRSGVSVHPRRFTAAGLMTNEATSDDSPMWKTSAVWLLGHASRFVPLLVIGAVVALTWQTLRQVHPRDIAAALRTMSWAWLLIAAAVTVVNIAVMGLYDVVAFRNTRTRAVERWRNGA